MGNKQLQHTPLGNSASGGRLGIAFFVIMIAAVGFYFVFGQYSPRTQISYSEFQEAILQQRVREVTIVDQKKITGFFFEEELDTAFVTIIPYEDLNLLRFLHEHNVAITGSLSSPTFFSVLIQLLPWGVMLLFLVMVMRQNALQSSKGGQFGKSRAQIFDGHASQKITFNDVAGQREAKAELEEVIEFLKNPQKFEEMGARIPSGVLLVGSPGTGKTLLAKAVAGEAKVSFLHISGSDFVEMFVGVGASRVRDLFLQARNCSPCIIFIDEIDAVGRARGAGFGGGHDEREQTLNQMLVEMDGFETKDGIIVLAATNRPDVLDPALLRPGRFDRQVSVVLPDIKERKDILLVHAKKVKLSASADLNIIARSTSGMSGADLANIINEAALYAARTDCSSIGNDELERARDKVLMGVARNSMVMPEKEKIMTAYHESGHALQYYFLENVSPLHKVTIIPRGRALGLTVSLPKEDSYSHKKSWMEDQLVILYGGYAAEKCVYNETSTGTQNDIARATDIARRMVTEWGMSEEVGAVAFGKDDAPIFMGKEIERKKGYSEYMAKKIDEAVKKILDVAENRAFEIVREHKTMLDDLAKELVLKETLDDCDIRQLLGLEKGENL